MTKRMTEREKRRLATIKRRHGPDFFVRNGMKAGRLSTTKFNSETARINANRRWAKVRAKRNMEKGEGE